ncbi:MAG: 4-hydroxythreonine-4-phosphate dehydrogenase PdxA, partial [Elusimicrobiaceae bacterium]|nr:4-hydroxythreonine-4-phosphate dehydrogenase PdxA [Elusimicrobiaceae bacterium]
KIAISALNPHAGDGGKLGKEEKKVIIPAIKKLKKLGYKVEGPYPPDIVWGKHITGEFDGVLAMYHDNALSALKLASIKPIVHLTAGLNIVRTSPTHGTAFDIAHKKTADENSMVDAILTAVKLSK